MEDDNRPIGYNENRDERVVRSSLEEEIKPLRERITAMEILLDARALEAKERERLLAEKESTIGILRREIVELKKVRGTTMTIRKTPNDVKDEQ
jgi:histidine ammonia-lyase